MDFEGAGILSSLFVSGIGFVFFSYGKKMARAPQIAAGLLLLVFPYFVSDPLYIWLIAAVICGVLWFALRLGW